MRKIILLLLVVLLMSPVTLAFAEDYGFFHLGSGENTDYLNFIGLTPGDIEAMYGQPEETEENVAEGVPYLEYRYRNACISFMPDEDDAWVADGVINYRPESPITIGGVGVGMDSHSAEEALLDNGYQYETTDYSDYMYYIKTDESGGLCLVMIFVDENLVSEVSGWYGATADAILGVAYPDTAETGGDGSDDYTWLLPEGEPDSSTTMNGYMVEQYADGTVSLNYGRGIIMPDGSVYINGTQREYIDTIEISDGGTISYMNDCAIAVVDGQLYVAANGGLILVDAEGNAQVYATP